MIFEKTLPLIIIFLLGYLLRRLGVFNKNDSASYGKLVMYVIVPAVAIKVFSTISVDRELILLPIAAVVFVLLMLASAWLIGRFIGHKGMRETLYLLFPTIEGGGIGYPIMFMVFADEGLSRVVLFDIGAATLLFTLIYMIASACHTESKGLGDVMRKMAMQPMIYAVVAGILMNLLSSTPALVTNLLDTIFQALVFVIVFMLGIDFTVRYGYLKAGALVTLAKTGLGLLIGILLVWLFGFTGLERTAVLVASILPASILTVAYAKENKMNVEFMANVFSISIPFSLVAITVLLTFL